MAICGAIYKYDYSSFNLYILEILGEDTSKKDILEREDFWAKEIKPSYNILDVLNPFYGENHPKLGREVSIEVRKKISASLKGRKLSEETKKNIMKGSKKKVVYCYDSENKLYVTEFESLREMSRQLNCSGTILIRRKIVSGKPFENIYKGKMVKWLVTYNKVV